MTIRHIPSTGLVLKHTGQKKDGDGPQIIRLDLLQSKSRDLLQQLRSGKKASLQTGKQAAVHYGKDKIPLDASSEAYPAEIYTRSNDQDSDMYFSGRLSLHLEMVRAREDTAKADAALANLQNTLTSMREEQLHNETTMMGLKSGKHGQLKPMQSRKDQLLGSGLSRPSSPFLGSAFSPAAGPTSVPMLGGSNPKDKIRIEAMRVPVIHLLASRPMSTTTIIDKIRAPREECERLLEKVARDSTSAPGKKELKDKTYRDLDVWRFPYAKESDRDAAIERAIYAFDRMRVEKTDNLWQLLLKAEERGKGKTLSRLNFDKPIQPPKPAAAPAKKADASEADSNPSPPKKSTTQKAADKKGLLKEPNTTSRAASPAPAKRREVPSKSTPSESKYKSAERIEDSDEEASNIEVVPKQPMKKKDREAFSVERASSRDQRPLPAPKKSTHKPSTSSSSSDNSDSSKSKSNLQPPAQENTSTVKSKQSPRPRHGSSPQKPSPLGSSPPANSTDFDSSSSTTTKGTSQSSAPSSPTSESEMPVPKQKQKYSPVVGDRARDTSSNGSMKRKQGDVSEAPPAKRQQVNGLHSKVSEGIKKPHERPQLTRKISESERSSSPEKPGHARDEVVDKAKRFQLYYKRYKTLHDKISSVSDKDRDSKDMDSLWVMHKRLRDMKTEIWQDWNSIEHSM